MLLNMKVRSFFIVAAATLINVPVMAMQLQADNPVKSITLMSEITQKSQQDLNNSVKKGLGKVKKISTTNGMSGHLHINDQSTYHLTVGTFEAADANNPLLSQTDSNKVWNTIGVNLKNNIQTYNQNGHVYGIYLFAHGYDANNNKVNYHYSNVNNAKANFKTHFDINKGIRLTHFHIVARHGTSHPGGQKGKFAADCEAGIQKLTSGANSKFQDANLQSSKGNYCGHITLTVMKRAKGTVTPQSGRFGTRYFDSILSMYEATAKDFKKNTANRNGQISINLSKFKTAYK